MSRRVFRVCRSSHARLDGEGAKQAGGRWNSPGKAVVYIAESVSLAVLENLVHMSKEDFPTGYVVVAAEIPDEVSMLEQKDLIRRFRGLDPAKLGDQWIESGASAVLQVRSAIISIEHNYLLKPAHPEFRQILVAETAPFFFDERLFAPRA
jgi:RES domain-containing protein